MPETMLKKSMSKNTYKLMMLPGDGIGPEVMNEVVKLAQWLEGQDQIAFEIDHDLVGGAAIDVHHQPVTDATLEKCKNSDAVMLGAVGGPKWDNVDYAIRPEAGLLKLRKDMDLFANLRPAIVFDALLDASSLKPDIIQGLDILIVRELTGGVYFGEPRGIEELPDGQKRGFNTQTYTSSEIRRVAAVAFDLAKKRHGKVCSLDKGNVMESGRLWREEVTQLHQEQYQDIELTHMYADNGAMQLLRWPKQFDVMVTDNLFGDILSDEAAMLTGSLGMLPSASLGSVDPESGKRYAMYEPVHGSAPDIAGQGKANPLAMILSFAMCLRYSLDRGDLADSLKQAVQNVLSQGYRTGDIMSESCQQISTSDMGDALLQELRQTIARAA
jgi:3-isopropylmalate dehydrogenase